MLRRSSKHEICTGATDVRAVHQETNVRGVGMFAAHSQTMLRGFHADGMALLAILQALSHPGIVVHKVLLRPQ
jgi:hypothetical protein